MILSKIAKTKLWGQEMTGFFGSVNAPLFWGRTRVQMGNTRDRDRSFPANLTMRAGNWIVNKIHCLRNGRPGHLQRTKAGDFHDVKKYSRRAEENRAELKEPTGTPMAGRRQSTWSRLVNEKRPPPKLRRTRSRRSAPGAAVAARRCVRPRPRGLELPG